MGGIPDQFDVGRNFSVRASAGIPADVAGIVHQGPGVGLERLPFGPHTFVSGEAVKLLVGADLAARKAFDTSLVRGPNVKRKLCKTLLRLTVLFQWFKAEHRLCCIEAGEIMGFPNSVRRDSRFGWHSAFLPSLRPRH